MTHDYLVIGAGPAGVQMGLHLKEAGRDHLILEAGDAPGTFFRTFPRHRTLISVNKPHTGSDDPEFNLRMDWNSVLVGDEGPTFTRYTDRYFPAADDMVRYLGDVAKEHDLAVRYRTRVERVTRDAQGTFTATDSEGGTYRASCLVMATGVSRPYIPAIPGIETAEQYATMPVDPEGFTDQRVLILGKGNSALETADNLVAHAAVIHVAGPHSLRLAWQTHFVGHLRAVNNNFLDTYQLKSQNAILDGDVLDIAGDGDGYRVRFSFARADDVVKELRYDRVLVCTGFRFDASVFAEECRPKLVIKDRFAQLTPAYESVDVPGLYFAGTVMQQRDFKRSTGGFIHGFRYAVRALHRVLEQRREGVPWPSHTVPATPEGLAAAVVARVNRTSALWQMFGELGDAFVVGDGAARHYEEVPVAYAHDNAAFGRDEDLFLVTLEYGPDHDRIDPFDISVRRVPQDEAGSAHDAAYLHPVIRHYRAGVAAGEHHMAENLENEWDRPDAHVRPLTDFFARALSGAGVPVDGGSAPAVSGGDPADVREAR
ncbi:NAD(P)-binding domain-containing protein [Streptomyces sp. ICBB 8177]|uniref:NAD(P)-binding domain-containing protein n=1 Tax=Streptomyces sp. ICBB 8177 TaxID=563922 RepID=UPI000D6739FE|nr:NAD(P)-binding domain-containing protein [Streptomyces sp. ICBB 8177]PWI42279.1 pyridine nucleotide-disulfide oxidoreductase [Streptomyces sp. ICBB 8177]